jgi:rubrerythrin
MVVMTRRAYELNLLSAFEQKQANGYESICAFINKGRFQTIEVCPVCGFLKDKNKPCKMCKRK